MNALRFMKMIKIQLLTSLTLAVLDLIYHRIEVQMFARLSGQPALPLLINKYLFERRTNITTSGYAFLCLESLYSLQHILRYV